MALIVGMPVVSRVMPMAITMPGMDALCAQHMAQHARHPGSPQMPADPTERCGYCVLLHYTPVLASDEVIHLLPIPSGPVELRAFRPRIAHALPWLSAHPRGPPVNV